jgi:hypothetical protein
VGVVPDASDDRKPQRWNVMVPAAANDMSVSYDVTVREIDHSNSRTGPLIAFQAKCPPDMYRASKPALRSAEAV